MDAALAPPKRLGIWLAAIRPATLWAGAVPVGVGLAIASREATLSPLVGVMTLLSALLIQIGCNLVNDYADFATGADNEDRLGPARATQRGWLQASEVARGAALALGLALLGGLYLSTVGGWPILLLGVLSLVCAVAYTAGPFPLGYHGLGDLFVLLFFGLAAVIGTVWLQTGALNPLAVYAGLGVGALATAILVVNNLRDRHTDARAGKRTLAVRFGARAARVEYSALLALAYALPLVGPAGWWLTWLSLPLALSLVRALWREDGAALNPRLGGTARLELVYGLLLIIGSLL